MLYYAISFMFRSGLSKDSQGRPISEIPTKERDEIVR
jgi:hypothetical protein